MLASAVVLGLFAGLATGGRLRNLEKVRIIGGGLVVVALLIRLAGLVVVLPALAYVATLGLLATVAVLNRAIPGALLVAAGITMNLLVIVANTGMPVGADALAHADAAMPRDGLHIPLSSETLFPFLADVVPVGLVRSVYSAGDFVLAIGGFRCTLAAVRAS